MKLERLREFHPAAVAPGLSFFLPMLCISYVDERNPTVLLFHLLIKGILQNQKKKVHQIKRSNRSFLTLQIGQISGGCSRAQR
jgi:hypothetical protein